MTEADADYLIPNALNLVIRQERQTHKYIPTKVGGVKCHERAIMFQKTKDSFCLEAEGIWQNVLKRVIFFFFKRVIFKVVFSGEQAPCAKRGPVERRVPESPPGRMTGLHEDWEGQIRHPVQLACESQESMSTTTGRGSTGQFQHYLVNNDKPLKI